MAQTYGYRQPKLGYGYMTPQRPRQPMQAMSPLALAAAGGRTATATDPFGLLAQPGKPLADGYFSAPNAQAPRTQTVQPPATTATPGVTTAPPATPGVNPPATVYDINTDPALQKANAFLGMNDEQSQAEALKQKQLLATQYGDPTFAASLFGANDPYVQAASSNPFSTVANLHTQHDRGLSDLVDAYNKQNLFYSGAHVKGEQEYAHDYEQALAGAAADANSQLGGIQGNLVSALNSSRDQRVQALLDAYDRHKNDPGATVPPPPPAFDTSSSYEIDPRDALMRALRSGKPVAV